MPYSHTYCNSGSWCHYLPNINEVVTVHKIKKGKPKMKRTALIVILISLLLPGPASAVDYKGEVDNQAVILKVQKICPLDIGVMSIYVNGNLLMTTGWAIQCGNIAQGNAGISFTIIDDTLVLLTPALFLFKKTDTEITETEDF